jgi:hypothetical protein
MARNVEAQLEAEADRKGLEGEARRQYIGGAWNRIRAGERRRAWWRHTDEYQALGALVGTIDDMRTAEGRPDRVYIRQQGTWYELPHEEYDYLVREGRALLKMERKARQREAREAEAQRRALQAVRRAEYAEVLTILRGAGGIRLERSRVTGAARDRGEYERLPATVRHRAGLLTLDTAATAIDQHMPWLQIRTGDDLVQYFEQMRTWRRNTAGRVTVAPELEPERPVPRPARVA